MKPEHLAPVNTQQVQKGLLLTLFAKCRRAPEPEARAMPKRTSLLGLCRGRLNPLFSTEGRRV